MDSQTSNSSMTFKLEMDEANYMLMRKVMTSYCNSINEGRRKKRVENTKIQKRTEKDMTFTFKIL